MGQYLRCNTLGDEAHGTGVDAAADSGTVIAPGNHDDGDLWCGVFDALDGTKALFILQAQIQQAHLDVGVLSHKSQRLGDRCGLQATYVMSNSSQEHAQPSTK